MPVSVSSAGSCFCAHSVHGCTDTMKRSWLPLNRFQSKSAAEADPTIGAIAAEASSVRRVTNVAIVVSFPLLASHDNLGGF